MLFANLLLALTWTFLSGRFTLDSLATGTVLGRIVLVVLAKGGVLPESKVGRLGRGFSLLGYLLWQIVVANFRITLDVIAVRPRMRPGVIRLPLDITTDGQILLLGAMINITPGSVALDVSPDRSVMYVHVMNMRTPEEARQAIKEGFERRVIELWGEDKEDSRAA
jgi:multicomponent Na+:H+ antiporter subunit E